MLSSLLLTIFLGVASAMPMHELGVKFEGQAAGDGAMPILTLPYGRFQATSYDKMFNIYTFKNIRFAQAPVGDLRWAKPAAPLFNATLSDGSYGPQCIQAPTKTSSPPSSPAAPESEDCLFLDLYVPAAALLAPKTANLPVIHWFFGGAYRFGSKDPGGSIFYDGRGLIEAAKGNVIFIASNYRVGAYGFLAGSTMEKQGLPNTGFYDQRAALQWTKDNIGLVGGNCNDVSAWGESAGAGSIMHHLVAFGGTQDPLFKKSVLQSPAFSLAFDRKGGLEDIFQAFATAAGCAGQGLACLRAASPTVLASANRFVSENAPSGASVYGPAPDGNLIRQLALLEFKSGNYFKGLDSLVLSHVRREPEVFVDGHVKTDAEFNTFIDSLFPPYAKTLGINRVVETQYPAISINTTYPTERARTLALIGDASFYCNIRHLSNAYAPQIPVYNMQYSVTPALHSTDLYPMFYNSNINVFGTPIPTIPFLGNIAATYQAYMTSHARSADPNTFSRTVNLPAYEAIQWPMVSAAGDALAGVLDVGDFGLSVIVDTQAKRGACAFWEDVAAAVTGGGGYAPPGSVVSQGLVNLTGNPSVNY